MDNLDPKKYHTLTPKTLKIIAAVGLVVLLLLPILSYQYYKLALTRENQGFKETTFEIMEGESVSSVASRLYEDELVNSEFLFKVHMIASGLHTGIQAGVYNIPAGTSISELGELFQHGTNDVQITFLEGWRSEEFALEAAKKFKKVDYQTFVTLAKEKEGKLFPDTYYFRVEANEEEILDILSKTFNEKTSTILKASDLLKLELTKEEVLIFASIVEREVRREEDRPIVAGILIKRWKNGELIGADATTQYVAAKLKVCGYIDTEDKCPTMEEADLMEWWPQDLTVTDLNLEDPYNTRKVVGLPPAPIANPGISAIESVMNYKETSYNYYLTDENGVTHYANTLDEHNRNIQEYLN